MQWKFHTQIWSSNFIYVVLQDSSMCSMQSIFFLLNKCHRFMHIEIVPKIFMANIINFARLEILSFTYKTLVLWVSTIEPAGIWFLLWLTFLDLNALVNFFFVELPILHPIWWQKELNMWSGLVHARLLVYYNCICSCTDKRGRQYIS